MASRAVVAMGGLLALVASCGGSDLKESLEKMNEGTEMFAQGRLTEAEKLYQEAASVSRENHMAWYNLGQVRDKVGKPEEAAEAYEQAIKINDKDAMYHYKLGKAYWATEDHDKAQTHLERAIQLNDRLYGAHYFLGKAYAAQDKPKLAAEEWGKSAKLAPEYGYAFIDLGKLYIRWDYLEQAISVLDQGSVNVKDPDDLTEIFYNLGLAYEKQGNWDQAIEAYSKALKKRKSNLDALRQRGFAYAEKCDKENARADLESFVQQGGGGDAFHIQAANERLFRMTGEGACE